EKVLKAAPDQTKVREHVDKLRQRWDPKSADHAKARAFVYKEWSKLEVRELKDNLDKARDALKVLQEVGDGLTARKMLQADVTHVAKLKKYLEVLLRQDSPDSNNQAKAIRQVADALGRIHTDAATLAARKEN